jgi:hypothetical protein
MASTFLAEQLARGGRCCYNQSGTFHCEHQGDLCNKDASVCKDCGGAYYPANSSEVELVTKRATKLGFLASSDVADASTAAAAGLLVAFMAASLTLLVQRSSSRRQVSFPEVSLG